MKQKGFTLIELIIVIVILGILAVTAVPKFFDFQSDARTETIRGVKAALQGGSQLVYSKAAIAGVHNNAASSITLTSGESVATVYGYPDATTIDPVAKLSPIMELDTGDGTKLSFSKSNTTGTTTVAAADANSFSLFFTGVPTCSVTYTNTVSAGVAPAIVVDTDGC